MIDCALSVTIVRACLNTIFPFSRGKCLQWSRAEEPKCWDILLMPQSGKRQEWHPGGELWTVDLGTTAFPKNHQADAACHLQGLLPGSGSFPYPQLHLPLAPNLQHSHEGRDDQGPSRRPCLGTSLMPMLGDKSDCGSARGCSTGDRVGEHSAGSLPMPSLLAILPPFIFFPHPKAWECSNCILTQFPKSL